MNCYFITSTGTDIGKTFVTAGLVRHLRGIGMAASALKPVVSGFTMESAATSDTGVLLTAMGEDITPITLNRISPWRYEAALSPDMAAAREGKTIDLDIVIRYCEEAVLETPGALFVEGVGGVMVPLDRRRTVLDWMAELRFPIILVAGSYLGTISHTLTALDCMARRKLIISALVISETGDGAVPLDETAAVLARFAPKVPIVTLARHQPANFAALWDAMR
jgi:dethiobiotin synthetase